jgi:cell wall-associated NlpC family hydrolase
MPSPVGAAAVGGGVLLLASALALGALGAVGDEEAARAALGGAGLGGGISDAVPAEYAPWVLRAGALCPEFPPAIIAAQIEAESNWNRTAVSPAGAQGPSQFMPGTWLEWGKDEDGNGIASPYDIADAVMAQGRYDCDLASRVRRLGGDTTSLALAAYNAGPGAVLAAGGIPPYPETQAYVPKILRLAAKYAAAPAGSATGKAAAVLAAARSQLGVDYSWGGGGPSGPSEGSGAGRGIVGFDCSGFLQYAFYQGARLTPSRPADTQARLGTAVTRAQIQPGDIVAFKHRGEPTYSHIGIYIGGGQMIHAPSTGDVVKISTIFGSSYYEAQTWSIRRYL